MKKNLSKLIVLIESNTPQVRKTNANIAAFINKIPVQSSDFNKPSGLAAYLDTEMTEYPGKSFKNHTTNNESKRAEDLKTKIRNSRSQKK
jgi:hypothetical protein